MEGWEIEVGSGKEKRELGIGEMGLGNYQGEVPRIEKEVVMDQDHRLLIWREREMEVEGMPRVQECGRLQLKEIEQNVIMGEGKEREDVCRIIKGTWKRAGKGERKGGGQKSEQNKENIKGSGQKKRKAS